MNAQTVVSATIKEEKVISRLLTHRDERTTMLNNGLYNKHTYGRTLKSSGMIIAQLQRHTPYHVVVIPGIATGSLPT